MPFPAQQGHVQTQRGARGRAESAEYVTLDFAKAIAWGERKTLEPAGVMKTLNKLGGKHGIGRVDMVENATWG